MLGAGHERRADRRDVRHLLDLLEQRLRTSADGRIGDLAVIDRYHELIGLAGGARGVALEQPDRVKALRVRQLEVVAVGAADSPVDRRQRNKPNDPRQNCYCAVSEAPASEPSQVDLPPVSIRALRRPALSRGALIEARNSDIWLTHETAASTRNRPQRSQTRSRTRAPITSRDRITTANSSRRRPLVARCAQHSPSIETLVLEGAQGSTAWFNRLPATMAPTANRTGENPQRAE